MLVGWIGKVEDRVCGLHGGFRNHRISRWSMCPHLCGLRNLIRSRRECWSRRGRYTGLSPFTFHFHSLGVRAFAGIVFGRRSFRSGCIRCVCIDCGSGSCDFAIYSCGLRGRLRAGRSIGARWLCVRCRRRCWSRSRRRGGILILAHDTFEIREHSPLLFVRKVQLGRPVALELRYPLHTFLEHILLLFVQRR